MKQNVNALEDSFIAITWFRVPEHIVELVNLYWQVSNIIDGLSWDSRKLGTVDFF